MKIYLEKKKKGQLKVFSYLYLKYLQISLHKESQLTCRTNIEPHEFFLPFIINTLRLLIVTTTPKCKSDGC